MLALFSIISCPDHPVVVVVLRRIGFNECRGQFSRASGIFVRLMYGNSTKKSEIIDSFDKLEGNYQVKGMLRDLISESL